MQIVDIPLLNDFTAKGHSRPSHGQMKSLFRSQAKRREEGSPEEIVVDAILLLGTAWDVTDDEGSPIPFSREGINAAPEDIVEDFSDKLMEFTNKGQSIGMKILALAETLEDDDPMKEKLLALVPEGN